MRKDAREFAFKMIYQNLYKEVDETLSFDIITEHTKLEEKDFHLYEDIYSSYFMNEGFLSNKIKSVCEGYELDRIYKVDLALLYLAIAEITFVKTPKQVVINEVLNLAKKYSTEKSVSFINGVLARVVKEM